MLTCDLSVHFFGQNRVSGSRGCTRLAGGAFCLSLKLGEIMSGPRKWGLRKKSGQQADYRIHPRMGVGDGCSVQPFSQGTGNEPFDVGPSGTMTHCRWDSPFSVPRLRPDLGLPLSLLYSCLLSLPLLSHHTSEQKMNMG